MADKKEAKRRRRENKEAREKEKAERKGLSPAQEAEAVRGMRDAAEEAGTWAQALHGPRWLGREATRPPIARARVMTDSGGPSGAGPGGSP